MSGGIVRCTCDRRHRVERFTAKDTHMTVRCTACGASWKGGRVPVDIEAPQIIAEAMQPGSRFREVIETTALGDRFRAFEAGRVI